MWVWVQALLEAGVDTDTQEKKFGLSPLMVAASLGHLQIVRALCDAGADINLQVCSLRGVVLRGARPGLPVTTVCAAAVQNAHLSTALMLACQNNQVSVCKVLLAYGADMGLQDVRGATAVMRACLVAHGATLVSMLVRLAQRARRIANIQVSMCAVSHAPARHVVRLHCQLSSNISHVVNRRKTVQQP